MRYYNDMEYGLIVDSEDDFETKMSVDKTVELLNGYADRVEELTVSHDGLLREAHDSEKTHELMVSQCDHMQGIIDNLKDKIESDKLVLDVLEHFTEEMIRLEHELKSMSELKINELKVTVDRSNVSFIGKPKIDYLMNLLNTNHECLGMFTIGYENSELCEHNKKALNL